MNKYDKIKPMVKDLGYVVAKATGAIDGYVYLTLFAPSDSSDNCFTPAVDLSINGKDSVIALRDFCNEVLEAITYKEEAK